MLDFFHLPNAQSGAETTVFIGNAPGNGHLGFHAWVRPRGKSMVHILLVGAGGDGGNGVIGAVSTAAGGGGGGGGSMCRVIMPADLLPEILYVRVNGTASGGQSCVTITPDTALSSNAMHLIALANRGGNGGNASGATAGTAGAAGGAPNTADMRLSWSFATVVQGHAGSAGGTTGVGTAVSLPQNGQLVTGGTGGAGLGNAGSTGSAGGAISGTGIFPTLPGGTAAGASTTRPGNGAAGIQPINKVFFSYGGTGGGSTAGNATGAGLVQASGGNGAPGCGGGGSGGALTGSTPGTSGRGGPAFCIITCW